MSGLSDTERERGETGYINGVAVMLMFTEADVEAIVAAREAAARQAGREEVLARVKALADEWLAASDAAADQAIDAPDDEMSQRLLVYGSDLLGRQDRLRALVAEFRAPDATSEARP